MAGAGFGARLGSVLIWWHLWVGRWAIHLPWMLCAVGYFAFLMWTAQGQTALEYPVEQPVMAILVVGALIGACGEVAMLLSGAFPVAMLMTTLACAPRIWFRAPVGGISGPRRSRPWGALACFAVLSGVIGGGVLSAASTSQSDWQSLFLPMFMAAVAAGSLIPLAFAGISVALWWVARMLGLPLGAPPEDLGGCFSSGCGARHLRGRHLSCHSSHR